MLYHDPSTSYLPLPGYFLTTNTPSPQMEMKILSYHKNTLGHPRLTSSLHHVPKTLPPHHNIAPCPQDTPSLRYTIPCPYDTPPYHYNVPRSPPPHTYASHLNTTLYHDPNTTTLPLHSTMSLWHPHLTTTLYHVTRTPHLKNYF